MILVVVIGFLIALMLLSRNYIKVSPNQAAVISGRSRKLSDGTVVGYRLVRGGATLIVPFLEKVEYLSLECSHCAARNFPGLHSARCSGFSKGRRQRKDQRR